jgi:O-antigen/teichoic acid export membrane protein
MRLITSVRSRGLGRNAALALLQSLVVMACLFLAYRALIAAEGLGSLGLWSLLMIFGGVAATFDISGVSALARFVARHDIELPEATRPQLIHTVLLTGMAINGVMLALLLLAAPLLLPAMIEPAAMPLAQHLLVWVAALMLVNPLALGVTTSIDGLMRADLRAILVSVAAVVGLLVTWFSLPAFGVAGLALGQLAQQGIVIVGGWLILRRHIAGLGWLPSRWRRDVFRATTGYALRLNLVGALGLLLEPLAKFCINAAGGTVAVGLYEIAARLAIQLRTLVINATMPLVPAFAAIGEAGSAQTQAMLRRAQPVVSGAAVAVALLSLAGAPVLSLLVLREISVPVLQMNALLAFGWSMNVLGVAFYLLAQAQGVLRWNIAAHAAIGLSILGFAVLSVGGQGILVVGGVAVGLLLSMAITIIGNARQFGLGAAARTEAPRLLLTVGALATVCGLAFVNADFIARTATRALHFAGV